MSQRGAGPLSGVFAAPVEINPASVFSQGLVSLHMPGVNVESLVVGGRRRLVNSGSPATASPYGTASSFDGTSQYLTSSDYGLPAGGSARTLAVLFRTSQTFSSGFWAGATYGSPGTLGAAVLLGVSGGDIGGNSGNGKRPGVFCITQWGDNVGSTIRVDDGLWHLGVATCDGNNTWAAYADGGNSDSGPFANGTNTALSGTYQLGGIPSQGLWFPGQIAAVWVWNRAFSAREVARHYARPFDMLRPVRRRIVPPTSTVFLLKPIASRAHRPRLRLP